MLSHKKVFAAPIILVLLGLAYYFFYFIKTPSYAVNQIRLAVEQRDTVKFQQYVDLDSVLDKAFEDLLTAESKIYNDGVLDNPFALSVLHMLKPTVVKLMKEEALEHIAPSDKKSEKNVADPVSDAMRRNLERRSHLDKLTYKSLQLHQEAKDKATVNVIMNNDEINKEFAVNLNMVKNDAGQWQVKEISNLSAIIMQIDAARKAKQASENQQMLNRLKQNLSVNDKKLTVSMLKASELQQNVVSYANAAGATVPTIASNSLDQDKLEPCLTSKVTLKNISGKTITRAYYDVEILDKDKKPFYSYPEQANGTLAPDASKEVIAIKRLNEQLPDDKNLAAQKDKQLECNIIITAIYFEDGSSIEPNPYVQY